MEKRLEELTIKELESLERHIRAVKRARKIKEGATLEYKREKWVLCIYAKGANNEKRKREIAYAPTRGEAIVRAEAVISDLKKLIEEERGYPA